MMEEPERRMVSRTTLAERPAARVRGLPEVRLLDLSLTGAQIEHLDLPPPSGVLSLPAQVVWCAVIGRKRKVGSGSHLLSRSSLRFTALTGAQHADLAWLLSTSYRQQRCSSKFDLSAFAKFKLSASPVRYAGTHGRGGQHGPNL
jgi:hypothetical protein